MKIIITRSYSRKVQVNQFEPIEVFSSRAMESEEDEENIDLQKRIDSLSKRLFEDCVKDVERDIKNTVDKIKNDTIFDEPPKRVSGAEVMNKKK